MRFEFRICDTYPYIRISVYPYISGPEMFVKLFRPECTCKRIYQFSNWQNTLLPRLENYSRFKRIIRDVLSSKSFFGVVQLLSQHNWSSLSSKSGENCVNRVALARIFQFGKNKQRKYFSFRTFMDTTKKDTIGKKKMLVIFLTRVYRWEAKKFGHSSKNNRVCHMF